MANDNNHHDEVTIETCASSTSSKSDSDSRSKAEDMPYDFLLQSLHMITLEYKICKEKAKIYFTSK